MTMGVVIDAMLPKVLNRPPERPAICLGEVSATTAQPSAPMPLPKKARVMKPTTIHSAST
ncbi:hypothetical protein D3C80_2184970 [compost metagenome]